MNAVPILLWQLSSVYSTLNTLRRLSAASGSDPTSSSLPLSTSSFLVYMQQHTCSRFGRCHYTNLLRSLHDLILISSWIYTPLWMLRLCCWAFRITSFRLWRPHASTTKHKESRTPSQPHVKPRKTSKLEPSVTHLHYTAHHTVSSAQESSSSR